MKVQVFADMARSIGLHNGAVRIAFAQLDAEGKASDVLDLVLPQSELKNLVEALERDGIRLPHILNS
jgi:hypothetical protein